MRAPLLALAAATACVLATARTADAAVTFTFDQDGPGVVNAPTPINGFNLSAGNALAKGGNAAVQNFLAGGPAAGNTFQLYVQVQVGNLVAPGGGVIPISPGQLTAVASITEVVTSASLATGVATFAIAPVQADPVGLALYAGPVANTANNLLGTGFITGAPILTARATQTPPGSLNQFTTINGTSVPFDQSPAPAPVWAAQQTVLGSGVSTVDFQVISTNPSFFPGASPAIIGLQLGNAGALTPFTAVNPSVSFTSPGGAVVAGVLGTINGNTQPGAGRVIGPDFQFQVSGTVTAVPEPSSVCLMGLGLAGLLVVARRKRTQVD